MPSDMPSALPTPEEVRQRLAALRADRGYVLAHHGALAAAAPDLHEAYERMYAALTRTRRHLDPLEKEFVWLALLVALKEAIGTHHLKLFREAGGSDAQALAAFRLAGFASGAEGFGFVAAHWREWFPAIDTDAAYLDAVARMSDPTLPKGAADLAMLAVHAALGRHEGVAAHLRAAYAAAIAEEKMVEALSLIIWPAGVNRFVEACTVWLELMQSGAVTPSERFRAWAEAPGQGPLAR